MVHEPKYTGESHRNKPRKSRSDVLASHEPDLLKFSQNALYFEDNYWKFWENFLRDYKADDYRNMASKLISSRCFMNYNGLRVNLIDQDKEILIDPRKEISLSPVRHRLRGYQPDLPSVEKQEVREIPSGSNLKLFPCNVFRLSESDNDYYKEDKEFIQFCELAVQRAIFSPIGFFGNKIMFLIEVYNEIYLVGSSLNHLDANFKFD